MKNQRARNGWAALAAAALALFSATAQDEDVGDLLYTAGTVATAPDGQDWAWILWTASESMMLFDRPMDVRLKAGDFSSPDDFVLKGTARATTDPRTIERLLARGAALEDDVMMLEASVDSLYAGAAPVASLTLAEKCAALVRGSLDDAERYRNLVLLARAHPSVAMMIGHGFACRIPAGGVQTFEVRDHATAEIIGRVALEGGNPVQLPAPGAITEVPDLTPKGNLNIRLRWEDTDDLRRLSLLQFGYDCYRVEKDFAESFGFDVAPPSPSEIRDMLTNNTEVVKVNRMPVLANDHDWFIADDNDGQSGGTPLDERDDYYYFVAALDLLGRPGRLSSGLLANACDRFAPFVPRGVRSRTVSDYDGTNTTQWVELSWRHDTNDLDVASYYVFRYPNQEEMQANAANDMAYRIAGPIAPSTNDVRMIYEDRTLTSNEFSRAFVYTVRAEDDGRCAKNMSGNSAPAFGLTRDWVGPPPPDGATLRIRGESPDVVFDGELNTVVSGVENIELVCDVEPTNSPIAWVEFAWHWGSFEAPEAISNLIQLGRFHLQEGEHSTSTRFLADASLFPTAQIISIYCRAGGSRGQISDWARYANEKPAQQDVRYTFKASISEEDIEISSDDPAPELPHVWGSGPTIVTPQLTIPPVDGAKTIRVYRRVDGGPRTLLYQGELADSVDTIIEDHSGGVLNGGTVCYYYQLFDEHGNAGPMLLHKCVIVAARSPSPTPALAPIHPTGTATANPGMALRWFCPPHGVERFEVAVAPDDRTPSISYGVPARELVDGAYNAMSVEIEGATNEHVFGFYRTARVGSAFGEEGASDFTMNAETMLDREYVIMLRAIGAGGVPGPWSNIETFRWSAPPAVGPEVPWPTRPLPSTQTELFHERLGAAFLSEPAYVNLGGVDRAAIRVGEFPPDIPVEQGKDSSGQLYGAFDPMDFLFTNAVDPGQTVFPCVMYRYQLTNELYETVSGDVAQVSPMMEDIAYGFDAGWTTVYDPFVVLSRNDGGSWGVYLIDTQPVVRGARYQYLLVRFDETTREIDRVIPAGSLTIP